MNLSNIGFVIGSLSFVLGLISYKDWAAPLDKAIRSAHGGLSRTTQGSWGRFKELMRCSEE